MSEASEAAAFTSSTRSSASGLALSHASTVSDSNAAAESVAMRIRARSARGTGCSARAMPRCASLVRVRCLVASAVTASASPTPKAALSTRNHGSIVTIATSRPVPSAPSMASRPITTPSAATGTEPLPRRPRPSKPPATLSPGASAGTSHSVIGPSVAIGRLDHTYTSAWAAEVTQDLRASSRAAPPESSAAAVLTGTQNWLPDPNSENATVARHFPAATRERTSSGPYEPMTETAA